MTNTIKSNAGVFNILLLKSSRNIIYNSGKFFEKVWNASSLKTIVNQGIRRMLAFTEISLTRSVVRESAGGFERFQSLVTRSPVF